jgi:pimeloyl-ACP methyl ester carboxylesterase
MTASAWGAIVGGLGLCLGLGFYGAYVFTPAEDRAWQSPYLKTIRSRFLTTPEFKIHYVHEGDGEPLILIHGGGTWLYSYRRNLPVLARHFSVYALDMPGHGYTQPLRDAMPYDLPMMSRVLLDFLDSMHLARATLVGHSWGGGWALYFAQEHPERVAKLVLIGSSGLHRRDRLEWELLKVPVVGELAMNFLRPSDVRAGLVAAFANPGLVDEEMVRELYAPLSFRENRRAPYRLMRHLDWAQTERVLRRIDAPTLIIWGADDAYISAADAQQMARLMPRAQAVVLDHCGHSAHEEQAERVNQIITEFAGRTG